MSGSSRSSFIYTSDVTVFPLLSVVVLFRHCTQQFAMPSSVAFSIIYVITIEQSSTHTSDLSLSPITTIALEASLSILAPAVFARERLSSIALSLTTIISTGCRFLLLGASSPACRMLLRSSPDISSLLYFLILLRLNIISDNSIILSLCLNIFPNFSLLHLMRPL